MIFSKNRTRLILSEAQSMYLEKMNDETRPDKIHTHPNIDD